MRPNDDRPRAESAGVWLLANLKRVNSFRKGGPRNGVSHASNVVAFPPFVRTAVTCRQCYRDIGRVHIL